MEKHCVSLEIAKQLKDAGWKKETEFYRVRDLRYQTEQFSLEYKPMVLIHEFYPAPLPTELLDELPREVSINQYPENDSVRYQVGYNKDKMAIQNYRYSNNLCDALAEMWLYLKANNLLPNPH